MKYLTIVGVLAALILTAAEPVVLRWKNPSNVITNGAPAEWVLFFSSTDPTVPLTNWSFTVRVPGFIPTPQVRTDATFTLWVPVSNEWQAVYLLTNGDSYVTSRVASIETLSISTGAAQKFFVCQFSNTGGFVSPFSNPVGFYTNRGSWLAVEGR